MKKQFLISNEEKNRILGLHESMKPNHGTSILKEEKYRKGDTINLVVKDTDEEVELLVTKRHSKDIYEGKIQNDSIMLFWKFTCVCKVIRTCTIIYWYLLVTQDIR